jgi:hypothetical protein
MSLKKSLIRLMKQPHRVSILTLGWIVLFTLLSSPKVQAQNRVHDHNANLWLMFFGESPINGGPWGLDYDAHIRRSDYGAEWQQVLVQAGGHYKTDKFSVGGGGGFMETYPYGDYPTKHNFSENRIYEQITIPMDALGLKWSSRLMLEQRFIETYSTAAGGGLNRGTRFENRIRFRLGTQIPLSFLDAEKYYVTASNEVFINTGADVAYNTFDQNRAYVGLGYKISKSTKVELGFMEQTLQHRDGQVWEHNHTLNLTLRALLPIH